MRTDKKKYGLSVTQNLIVTVLIILLFLGVVTLYYILLKDETRDHIVKSGELDAVNAATRIDGYLSTGVNSIKLVGFSLDNMIRDKRSQEDILDFLINQSFAVANVVSGHVNGVYGFINGEYLDGSLWKPGDDYVPTERPWYIEAMARAGQVVVIDPYIDAETGETMITIAKTLCDAKSVVAIDISMDQLQRTTVETAVQGTSDMEFVLTRNYRVVSHSDPNEVGKDYFGVDGSFGSAVVERLRKQTSNRSHFSVEYGEAEYIVYAITIENEWMCLSVTNATISLQRLREPLIFTVIVSFFFIVIFLVMMVRTNRKDALADKMKQLAAQQTEYAYKDQMTGLKNRRAYTEEIERLSNTLPLDCRVVILDVNGLKTVNDTYGHKAGDELIVAAADCIRSSFEGIDSVYRIGGDEFCIITSEEEEKVKLCLEQMEKRAADWEGNSIHGFSVSYGTVSAKGFSDMEAALRAADRKMYENKSSFYKNAEHDRRRTNG